MRSRIHLSCAAAGSVVALASIASADLRMPAVFGDHMVLQQKSAAPLWGWVAPGQHVEIVADWIKTPIEATADAKGVFHAQVPTQAGSDQPHEMKVLAGDHEITYSDILIGEVWICSGQSNMEFPLRAAMNHAQEVAKADHPTIRLFQVVNDFAQAPQQDCGGHWQVCSPKTAAGFSAVGYYFGRDVQARVGVPIGLIDATWGGTVAESWTSAEGLRPLGDFNDELDRIASGHEENFQVNHPTALYNAMIAPLQPYAIRGVIWYQGEANVGRGRQYRRLFPALIGDWRRAWGGGERGDFPFYYVQIAPWKYPNDNGGAARLREAQLMTLSTPNTGMVVITDIGNVDDIHPRNKQEVGRRLSLWALAKTYNQDVGEYSGLLFDHMEITDGKAVLHFSHDASGLKCHDDSLSDFRIAGADRVFHEADATIVGKAVVVSSPEVAEPVAVRFGFNAAAEPNLFNGAGLPASPFRTDDWEDVP